MMDVIFQSTSPVRGTTARLIDGVVVNLISIHVPREGDDNLRRGAGWRAGYFNPRPP